MKAAKIGFVIASICCLVSGPLLGDLTIVLAGVGWGVLASVTSPAMTIILRDGLRIAPTEPETPDA